MILSDGKRILAEGENLQWKAAPRQGEAVRLWVVALGGGKAGLDIDIDFPGVDVRINGLYICSGEDRLGIKVNLRHNAGGSISDQTFLGIADGRARASFDGLIRVAPDAQKTEAYQTNRNLQLSEDAVVQTSPQLEIYADDVKCSHGATVGSLNEDEQFYMRSRGISPEEARRLQIISFLSPVMAGLPEEIALQVQERLEGIVK